MRFRCLRGTGSSPEILELAKDLGGLVAAYRAEVGTQPFSDADELRVRLAEARIANAATAVFGGP